MSFKDNLYNLVKEKGIVTYGELVNFSMEENYKPDTMTRRMRELCDQKGIESLEKIGKRNQKYIYAYRLVSEPREGYPLPEDFGKLKDTVTFDPRPKDILWNDLNNRVKEGQKQYFKDYLASPSGRQTFEIVGGVLKVGDKEYPIFNQKKEKNKKELKEVKQKDRGLGL